ncbi:MAG: shikimate kinase [Patescibacteria group bacterium]
MSSKHIFIIGPGGVGKSTSGALLASVLRIPFIDLDQVFMHRIGPIDSYIQEYGYKKYCLANSELFYSILTALLEQSVIVLSSGFLAHEEMDNLTTKHRDTLKEQGVSICLLPSVSIKESTDIIVRRQLARGFGLEEKRERKKFMERYRIYNNIGDIQIYSIMSPENIAIEMAAQLSKRSRNFLKKR